MISIVDYGCGNLASVQRALNAIGYDNKITPNPYDLADSSAIILPGVGAFSDAIKKLRRTGLKECIDREVRKGKPLLGICLGMQLLFEKSYEDGEFEGLGYIAGEVIKFDVKLKIPHIGWNDVEIKKDTGLFDGIEDRNFYFVHSYHASSCLKDQIESVCLYEKKFVSSVSKDNVFGVQFHPEKSGNSGLKLLKNFGGLK